MDMEIDICEWGVPFNDVIAGATVPVALDDELADIPFNDWRINRVAVDVRRPDVESSGLEELISISLQPEGTLTGDLSDTSVFDTGGI
jgi:hypothetical protein